MLHYVNIICFNYPEQIIWEGGPGASEAVPASSGAGEVPSHGQEAGVSRRPGARLGACQEAGASRSREGAASLLAGTSPPGALAACEAGPLVEEASEPWGESRAGPGAAGAWRPGAALEGACSLRRPSCSEEAAPG